jgi:hypothetical protein
LVGHTLGGEPVLQLAMEQPERTAGWLRRVEKPVLERVHLERYRSNVLIRTGSLPFEGIVVGDDPPDFIVTPPQGRRRIDCAAFASTRRRRRYNLFNLLRERRGVSGHQVVRWRARLHPAGVVRVGQHAAAQANRQRRRGRTAGDVASAAVDREAIERFNNEVAANGLPEKWPSDVGPHWTAGKEAGFSAVPVQPGSLVSDFAHALGFEIQLRMSQQLLASELRVDLQRVVPDHNKPEIEQLLITAGGPDRHGLRHPGEETALRLVLGTSSALKARYLQQITFHF